MSKTKAVLNGILNTILFIPRNIWNICCSSFTQTKNFVWYYIVQLVLLPYKLLLRYRLPPRIAKGSQSSFTKVKLKAHDLIKDPVQILYEECKKSYSGPSLFGTYYKKSDRAIEALADLMCPHGEDGCGKIDCNIDPQQRRSNFEARKEQLKKDYIMETFMRSHRWRIEFGSKQDDAMLLFARSAKISRKPSFFRKGLMEITFYLKPEIVDYLAGKPKAKVARMSMTEGDGSLMSYIEFDKFKLHNVDFNSIEFDYTKDDISTIKATFSFKKSRFFGTVTTNGPIEKAVT